MSEREKKSQNAVGTGEKKKTAIKKRKVEKGVTTGGEEDQQHKSIEIRGHQPVPGDGGGKGGSLQEGYSAFAGFRGRKEAKRGGPG